MADWVYGHIKPTSRKPNEPLLSTAPLLANVLGKNLIHRQTDFFSFVEDLKAPAPGPNYFNAIFMN